VGVLVALVGEGFRSYGERGEARAETVRTILIPL
jgi:hypothetical protein